MSFHVLIRGKGGHDNDLTWKPQSHLAHALASHYDLRKQDPHNYDENIPKSIVGVLDQSMPKDIVEIRSFCLGILNKGHGPSMLAEFEQLSDEHLLVVRQFIAECAAHDGMTVLY
jgi:hypothetical protein